MVIATMNMIVCLFDKVMTVTLSRKRRRQGRSKGSGEGGYGVIKMESMLLLLLLVYVIVVVSVVPVSGLLCPLFLFFAISTTGKGIKNIAQRTNILENPLSKIILGKLSRQQSSCFICILQITPAPKISGQNAFVLFVFARRILVKILVKFSPC